MRFGMMLGGALALVSMVGCNQVAATTKKQADALTAVVRADCDKYQACGQIGSGQKYPDRATCENESKGYWAQEWPTQDCDGKINGSNLDTCTTAITNASCNGFERDFTKFDKCDKDDVCNGQ